MIAAAVVSFIALAATAVGQVEATSRPAPLSTPILKQHLADAQARVWAWEIEYESAREIRPGVLAESYVRRVVAASEPDRFFHWSAHGTPWLDWQEDPYQQRLTVTADRMFVERPLDRIFYEQRLRSDAPLPGTALNELLLIALGWWTLAERPSPTLVDKLPTALSAVAQASEYQVRPRLEQVGGQWCHVLECPGRDQLWLDVDRGFAVVARQISYPSLARVHRVECDEFRELRAGIWAPFRLRNTHYEIASDGTPGRVLLDATLNVLRIRLNEEVDDARFQFEPRPGSVGTIDDQPSRQAVPGGEDYLDEVVEWVRRYAPKADRRTWQTGWVNWVDIALEALFGSAVVVILLWRPYRVPRSGGNRERR